MKKISKTNVSVRQDPSWETAIIDAEQKIVDLRRSIEMFKFNLKQKIPWPSHLLSKSSFSRLTMPPRGHNVLDQKPCKCRCSDAWHCAQDQQITQHLTCHCPCHRYITQGLTWDEARMKARADGWQ